MNQLAVDIDNELYRADDMTIRYLLNDEEIKESLYSNNYQWNNIKIYRMKNKMQQIIKENEIVQGLDIYYYQSNILFLSGNYKKLTAYASIDKPHVDWLSQIANQKNLFWIPSRVYEPLNSVGKEVKVATSVQKLPYFTTDFKGCLAIHYNLLKLEQLARILTDENEAGTVSIITEDGVPIINTIKPSSFEYIQQEGLLHESAHSYNKETKNITFYRKSKFNNWIYVYELPFNKVFNQYDFIMRNVIISFIILLFSIVFFLVVNVILYRPINQLFSTIKGLPDKQEDELEQDDIHYLQDKLSKVSKHLIRLEDDMSRNKQIIYKSLLKRIMMGNEPFESLYYNEDHVLAKHTHLLCLMIVSNQFKEGDLDYITELNRIRDNLVESNEHYQTYILVEDNKIICLVNFDLEQVDSKVVIKKIIVQEDNNRIVVASGCILKVENDDISITYRQALEALDYKYIMPRQTFLDYPKERFDTYKTTGSREFIIKNLEKAIILRDYEAIQLELKCIFKSLNVGKYNIKYSINTCYEVCATIRRGFRQMNIDVDAYLGYDLRNAVNASKNVLDLELTLQKITLELLEKITVYSDEANKLLKEKIMSVISDNLLNNITLQMVADKVEIRYDTLSRIFKELMGSTFSSYIREMKLIKAVELLNEKKYTVKEIASQLGYSSPHYFIQLFKDKYNITPKKYQNERL